MSARSFALARCALLAAGALLLLGAVDIALAQPFGMTRSAAPVDGLTGWIFAKQAEFYRMMSGTIRAAKQDGSAAYTLMGISFLYGIFHAAGPGHGKAVITSYLLASGDTARRGIALSFLSAAVQAASAIIIVAIGATVLKISATAARTDSCTVAHGTISNGEISIFAFSAVSLIFFSFPHKMGTANLL
jgi:nickel/cobalt exporter